MGGSARRRPFTLVALAAIALASVAALAWPALPWNAAREPAQRAGVITRVVDARTPVVGQPAPDVEWALPDGTLHRLSGLRGTPVIVNFWATWCAPCVKELPALDAVGREEQVAVVAVDLDEPPDQVDAFLGSLGLTHVTPLLDPGRALATRWAIVGAPTSYFIAADGTVRAIEMRELDEARIRDAIRRSR